MRNEAELENDKSGQDFEAFKLEYEKASERYENVYRAVWQNFYYMAFFAGGLFAFSPDALPLALRGGIGLTPLVFWFWASFLPLDHYGRQTRLRLGMIEEILNHWFMNEDSISEAEGLSTSRADVNNEQGPRKKLEHYRWFANTQEGVAGEGSPPDKTFPPGYRVRDAVCSFGFAVTSLCATLIAWYLSWFLGWHLGTSKLADSAGFLKAECLLLIVVVLAALLVSVFAYRVNYRISDGVVSQRRMWLIIIFSLVIYGFLWGSYLTDACAQTVQAENRGICWAEKASRPSVDITVNDQRYELQRP